VIYASMHQILADDGERCAIQASATPYEKLHLVGR
jgi:hypothetical protein